RKVVLGMVMLPIAVAGVPLLDVLLAIWRRGVRHFVRRMRGEAAGIGLFDADRDHLHHRLLDSGKTQHKVALLLQGVAVVLALLAFLPMLFGTKLIGISLVGFLIVGLLGLRSLAQVELQNTGCVVHLAIKLPGPRRRVAAALFFYDLLMLAATAGLAILIETNGLKQAADPQSLWFFVLLFTILGSCGLLLIRVHRQLWVRATIHNVLLLQSSLLISSLATLSLYELVFFSLEWGALRMAVMACAFASVAVCIPRMALVLLREAGFTARHRVSKKSHGEHDHPVVVVGAGDLGTLLLDHLKTSSQFHYPGVRILGFVDQTRQLHGRQLRSFRVLGGLSVVPGLVENQGLKGVILAINQPNQELIDELADLVERYDLKIHRWNVGIQMEA
ncbi:MAG: hypothetical protein K9N23_22840, partial [Akkermansiaceae bacterium]|nr:hypothetical protein [Akkermansiaceae bacterium]